MTSHQPHLYQVLRTALGVLYSLPSGATGVEQKPTPQHAHEFLMQFQSRNVRRKLQSLSQKYGQQGNSNEESAATPPLEADDYGSTWLSCLALLFSLFHRAQPGPEVHYAEALFAAQTLVHRLRRVKTNEAIDLEFEPPLHSVPPQASHLFEAYLYWMEKFDPTIRSMLQQYSPSSNDEECIKAELTMITLMTIMYRVALCHYSDISRIRPLLATLASAFAVTAARLRFTTLSMPDPSPNTQPIVTMILQTLTMVRQVLSTTSAASNSPEQLAGAFHYIFYTCMTVTPDAILAGSGSGGGAHGKISMDPRCYTAMTTEVRTQGITQVWEAFAELPSPEGEHLVMFLHMCEEWAKYAPLPLEFAQRSITLVENAFVASAASHSAHDQATGRAAMRYWTAIMEGGSWSVDEVLLASLIQKNESSQQPNKKKQSTRSKKRQKEVLDERTTASQLVLAQNEVRHRGEVAMHAVKRTWSSFRVLLSMELSHITDSLDEVPGDGPVGGITACANACLCFLVRESWHSKDSLDLFVSIGHGVQDICGSQSRMVRSFAAETLYTLHEAVLEVLANDKESFSEEMEAATVEHFYQCAMKLAMGCGYPSDYFHDLGTNNDDDLENERNDVRDVLRTLSSTTTVEGKSVPSAPALRLTTSVLQRLLLACSESILTEPTDARSLYPETAIHAFSALARPLIACACSYAQSPNDTQGQILSLALTVITKSGERLTNALTLVPLSESLPMSRLYNLAVASLSPMLSALCNSPPFENAVVMAMNVCVQAALASMFYIPELAAPSTLRSTRYDIRGAMRTPGGEDHAGCLALMRLATESEQLSHVFVNSKANIALELCHLYGELKQMEKDRGRGVLHGKGVLPKSRRILLGVICHLEIITRGAANASDQLRNTFMISVESIARMSRENHLTLDLLFDMAENVFDLAAFSPEMIHSLFNFAANDAASPNATCLLVLTEGGNFGFRSGNADFEAIYEWNRLRAALYCLFKGSGAPDLPNTAIAPITKWIQEECDAIIAQCNLGPKSASTIFCEELISEDGVPAGVFVYAIGEILGRGYHKGVHLVSMPNCIQVLLDCKSIVLQAIGSTCSSPFEKGSFCDPRPTLAEAWIIVVMKLMDGWGSLQHTPELADAVHKIIVETCLSSIGLLLYPSLGKTQEARADDPGLSMDGPHMLVMMEFLQKYFSLGPSMLHAVARELLNNVPIDLNTLQSFTGDQNAAGIAIVGAAIFRAAQGGLPPWAVESVPAIYSSLYKALDQSPENFALVMHTSMSVRLAADHSFGGIKPGRLLSGRFFDSMGEKAKSAFITQAVDIAKTNTPAAWKRLKALVKQACGGKKKDTDFRQRPALTKYDALDRV